MNEKEMYLKGIEEMRLGNYKSAYQTFSKAIEVFPKNADLHSERGVVLFHLKDLNAALQDMNKAQELEPNKPYRYSSRAFIKDALSDTQGAIEDYKKAISLDPNDEVALNNLGLLEEKLGYKEMAVKRFEKADKIAAYKNEVNEPQSSEIDEEGEKLIDSFKKELNLTVVEDDKGSPNNDNSSEVEQDKGIWQIMTSIFKSKNAFKDYVKFLKKLLGLND